MMDPNITVHLYLALHHLAKALEGEEPMVYESHRDALTDLRTLLKGVMPFLGLNTLRLVTSEGVGAARTLQMIRHELKVAAAAGDGHSLTAVLLLEPGEAFQAIAMDRREFEAVLGPLPEES